MNDADGRTWGASFPVVSASAAFDGEDWWAERIEDASPEELRARLGHVAAIAASMGDRRIGDLFPAPLSFGDVDFPVRIRTAFAREGIRNWSDLSSFTVDGVRDWRNIGEGTVLEFLGGLVAESLASATHPPSMLEEDSEEAAHVDAWSESIKETLSPLAGWAMAIGREQQPLVRVVEWSDAPDAVLEGLADWHLTAYDILGPGAPTAATLLAEFVWGLDDRQRTILLERVLAEAPAKLEELGDSFGVSRERIRQIEGKTVGAMSELLGVGVLRLVVESLRAALAKVRPLDDLVEAFPVLAELVAPLGVPVWRILSRFDDSVEIRDGWCARPSLSAAVSRTRDLVEDAANSHGVARIDTLNLDDIVPGPEFTDAWLIWCGFAVMDGHVLTSTRNMGDFGVALLAIEGEPMDAEEILDRMAVDRTPQALRNALGLDSRIIRVDRGRYALADWGLESYGGIRQMIREQVAAGGGAVTMEDLLQHAAKFSVAPSSVVAYANAHPFVCTEGIVQYMPRAASSVRRKPEDTRRLFRGSGAWLLRITVTFDHLRGSGFAVPASVASLVGIQPGQERMLPAPYGEQAVRWTGLQPSMGAIRAPLLDLGATEGDEIFLLFGDDGTFSLRLCAPMTGRPLEDAATLAGAEAAGAWTDQGLVQFLASAVGLDPDGGLGAIGDVLLQRGDEDVAALVRAV